MLLTCATFAFMPAAFAVEDDFGALFTGSTPAGLRDTSPVGDVVGKDLFDPEDIENFDPNAIEPAAGDEEAACSADAIDAASAGGTVSYSFGGSLEENLADALSCGAGSL